MARREGEGGGDRELRGRAGRVQGETGEGERRVERVGEGCCVYGVFSVWDTCGVSLSVRWWSWWFVLCLVMWRQW